MRVLTTLLAGSIALAAAPAFAQAPGEPSAVIAPKCDRACLIDIVEQHMKALAARDPSLVKLAPNVRYAENDVLIPVGKGLWATVTGVDAAGLTAADPLTGNAAWFGSVRENGVPAVYAVRVHVTDGAIDEIEAVVHRKTALPAPFGDTEHMVHDPLFKEPLAAEDRRPRERLLRVADGYFSTVELNDGQVLTDFTDDCGRLENGISTTAPQKPLAPGGGGGNAAAIASGCRAQFELGLYRINKRIRRDFFIVDEERGVAVGRGFFDHANEFDHYLLTNGREMKTALKWPNSITLLEAFRIKGGAIQRIEAVFTYVPYFMPNPFRDPSSVPPKFKHDPGACDARCLDANARKVATAMVGNDWKSVPWASAVGYAENSVGIRVGEGIWATVTAVDTAPLVVADQSAGKAVWIGRLEEHGQPAWAAFTVSAAGDRIGGIEALIHRKEYGPPYVEPESGALPRYPALPAARRTGRAAMIEGAMAVLDAAEAKAPDAPAVLADTCSWRGNGFSFGPCRAPFGTPAFAGLEHIRDREVLAADEARGLVAIRTFEDVPALGSAYPLTQQVIELMHFDKGKIVDIRSFSAELPYGMKPHG